MADQMTPSAVPSLVAPDWLEPRLEDPQVRVLDCTAYLRFDPETGARRVASGHRDWRAGHVPGSRFVDVPEDLSATGADGPGIPLRAPSPEAIAEAIGGYGVGDDSVVVLYDRNSNRWAARVWWLLRSIGFDRAGILDGGWQRWTAADRPVSAAPVTPESASLSVDPRPEAFASKAAVRASLDRDDRCLVNALRLGDHAGRAAHKYGRAGHIPSSKNVPALGDAGVVDPETGRYDSRAELRRRFTAVGAFDADSVITYCGSGLAASIVAVALTLVGVEDVAVYDGSLSQWAADPDLPMETGPR